MSDHRGRDTWRIPPALIRERPHGFTGILAVGLAIALLSAGTARASDHQKKTRLVPQQVDATAVQAAPVVDTNVVQTPEACTPGNIIVDGGFETCNPSTGANANWPATSTQFGNPFCSAALCGTGNNTALPRTGTFFSWFGGVSGATPETATISQARTFPDNTASSVTLNFYLWIGSVQTPFTDVLNVKVDGVTQMTFTEPATAEPGYTLRSINLTSFANGASHTILFEYIKGASGGTANFSVDDVTLDVVCGAAAAAKDSIGLFTSSNNTFYLRNTNDAGPANVTVSYGAAGDVPITGDWNGDGTDTIGVYRPSTGEFLLRNSNTPGNADIVAQFGPAGSNTLISLSGDWNNDNTDTIGLYDTSNGVFQLKNTNAGGAADITFSFGTGGVGIVPLVGDWNNDGTDTIALFNMSTAGLFVKNTNAVGGADITITYGAAGSGLVPIAGDWNNDGSDSIGGYLPSTGGVFLKNTIANGAADITFVFGSGGATPRAGDWDNLP